MKGTRSRKVLRPDAGRVLFRPFEPPNAERIIKIVARVMALEEREAKRQSERMLADFVSRHNGLRQYILQRFDRMKPWLISDEAISDPRKLLIGAYFTQEYALEAAALFNPSIVPHPDQSGAPEGGLRFALSLRATGEGHISSIVFREGSVLADGGIRMDEPSPIATSGEVVTNPEYETYLFGKKLKELGLDNAWTREVLGEFEEEHFTFQQLEAAIGHRLERDRFMSNTQRESANAMRSLAQSNYCLRFDSSRPISERVLFPYSPTELKGIEDARFVRFVDEDGARYYATYTAFNGHTFVPQFIETDDFADFKISTLNGPEATNKGFALFPRKVGGRYAMISRQDNENIFIMYSDMLHFWYEREILLRPTYDWEFVQLGNCGSPIETEAGWLLITHGVGFMRRYSIGAALLDLDNPSKVIGRTKEPILAPNEREREGYVPNVVYSCGSLVHNGRLILPYALSDQCSSFATFDLQDLLDLLLKGG